MKKIIFVLFLFGKAFAQEDESAVLKKDTASILSGYRTAIDEIRNTLPTLGGLTQAQANLLYQPIGSYASTAQLNTKADLAAPTFSGAVRTTGSFGYAIGAGGSVTQQTSKTTGVTINKIAGQITMNGAALAAGAEASFVVSNNTVAATDIVIVGVQSVGTAGAYLVSVGSISNGSFTITVSNASAGSLSQALVLNFAIIKSVSQ